MYGIEQMAREIRKLIVSHVTKYWTEFSIMSHDNNRDNYMSSAEYFADMSQLYTYGGLCELVAAGQLLLVLRMRFMQNLSRGHFDVYLPNESEILIPQRDSTLQQSPFSLSLKKGRKCRARYTGNIRKKQLQNAAKTYALCNPLVNRSAVARYQLDNPEEEKTPGICCNNGKVQLPSFEYLPEPLNSLLMDRNPHHNHFTDLTRKYNGYFQMTSFGVNKIVTEGFMPTFKVQGQVYHLVGSLMHKPDQNAQFLQIYFVSEDEREIRSRCANFPDVKPGLVKQSQSMLHEKNSYVKQFKTTIARRKLNNAHVGRFNAPTQNEIALIIGSQKFENKDIVLQSHDNKLQCISEIHRAYDALQYPLMFCHGEDGYSINIPLCNPTTKLPLEKKVSAASFYAYRIMIRQGEVNHILYFRSFFSQFLIDIFAKIETERLNCIRNHQKQVRAENYIHLKDAVGSNDVNATDLGQIVVLPSSFTGGPRYMHERTQDAMTYFRVHGHPDLFITFTCNPTWKDIIDALFSGQKPHDRHDIIARVFHIKVKKLMALLTKGKLFGDISAEIPDPEQDSLLYDIVKSNMVHGPCDSLNPNAPCMKENTCSKRYPRKLCRDKRRWIPRVQEEKEAGKECRWLADRKEGRCIRKSTSINTIHPHNTECYYIRMLLREIRGPTSFSDLKTVNGILHNTFQSACDLLDLLEDDNHWNNTLNEASLSDSPSKLYELFTVMLVFCQLSDPLTLWDTYT
ncbi:hypothetical protein AGLY_016280 [Aphis glycines]|uniref:Helitron helicase-like domain-containing protein n=1 Tax=Aphis glycines TaxID=307491 RepID=A0A6G0SYJ7_APHGL|nr:hypothetical protein AGLY_016280 [Aphis glycines]